MTNGKQQKEPRTGQSQPSRQSRRQGAAYQGAFEAVIALLVAVVIGYWLDGYLDTAPVLLLVGTAIGFASFTVRLIRLGRWMQGAPPGESDEVGESKDENDR